MAGQFRGPGKERHGVFPSASPSEGKSAGVIRVSTFVVGERPPDTQLRVAAPGRLFKGPANLLLALSPSSFCSDTAGLGPNLGVPTAPQGVFQDRTSTLDVRCCGPLAGPEHGKRFCFGTIGRRRDTSRGKGARWLFPGWLTLRELLGRGLVCPPDNQFDIRPVRSPEKHFHQQARRQLRKKASRKMASGQHSRRTCS